MRTRTLPYYNFEFAHRVEYNTVPVQCACVARDCVWQCSTRYIHHVGDYTVLMEAACKPHAS